MGCNTMKKKTKVIIIVVVIVLVLIAVVRSCQDMKDPENWGASVDWGDYQYWNSETHQVEKKPWK